MEQRKSTEYLRKMQRIMPTFPMPSFGQRARLTSIRLLFAFCALAAVANSSAITITYETENLTDLASGEDLWKYSYTVSDFDFAQNQGFTIYFEADKFQNLEASPETPNADWHVIIADTVPLIEQEGWYDALSIVLVGVATLSDPFTLSFIWTGTGAPGSQFFTINQFDAEGNFLLLDSGETVAAATSIPDGGSGLLLLGLALGSLASVRYLMRYQIGRSSVCNDRSLFSALCPGAK